MVKKPVITGFRRKGSLFMKLRTPTYRLHRPSGRAVVTLGGRDFYLGPYDSPESHTEFNRLVGEWLVKGRPRVERTANDRTINELLLAYIRFAEGYYRKPDGRQTSEVDCIKLAMRPLRDMYGHTLAGDFGPLALKVVRERMIATDLCRTEVNKRVRHIVRMFRWAVENELAPAEVHHAIRTVAGLKRGRSAARESKPVKPVPEAFVDAIQSHVLPPIWAMVELQRLTGMRPGEVVIMRTCDVDTSGRVWVYRPSSWKTEHHEQERRIFLGPRAQEVLKPWLRPELQAYLFNPREAIEARNREWRGARQSKVQPSQRNRGKAKPKWVPSEVYSVASYGKAIRRGCEEANVPHWHPHQLRHNAATWLRKEFGLDIARVILGHRSSDVTEIYAELDFSRAVEVVGKIG